MYVLDWLCHGKCAMENNRDLMTPCRLILPYIRIRMYEAKWYFGMTYIIIQYTVSLAALEDTVYFFTQEQLALPNWIFITVPAVTTFSTRCLTCKHYCSDVLLRWFISLVRKLTQEKSWKKHSAEQNQRTSYVPKAQSFSVSRLS